jgi:hypothetical protein
MGRFISTRFEAWLLDQAIRNPDDQIALPVPVPITHRPIYRGAAAIEQTRMAAARPLAGC